MVMDHTENTFSYSNRCTRNWIERKLCPTYCIVIKRIDSDNAELYFWNSTTSYCNPPINVIVTEIKTNKSIPCLPNNSYCFAGRQDYKVTKK